MVLGCLAVYFLTSIHLTGIRERRIILWTLFVLAAVNVFMGLRQFSYGDNWMPFGFIRADSGRRASGMDRSGAANAKSTTKDILALINRLKMEGITGLVMDLRRDGGGALDEAVNLTGLFVKRGPVVQAKDWNGNIHVLARAVRHLHALHLKGRES